MLPLSDFVGHPHILQKLIVDERVVLNLKVMDVIGKTKLFDLKEFLTINFLL